MFVIFKWGWWMDVIGLLIHCCFFFFFVNNLRKRDVGSLSSSLWTLMPSTIPFTFPGCSVLRLTLLKEESVRLAWDVFIICGWALARPFSKECLEQASPAGGCSAPWRAHSQASVGNNGHLFPRLVAKTRLTI